MKFYLLIALSIILVGGCNSPLDINAKNSQLKPNTATTDISIINNSIFSPYLSPDDPPTKKEKAIIERQLCGQ